MPALFHVSIMTPGKLLYDLEASSLVIPAELGYLGVLAHHAPIIARLKPGKITFKDAGNRVTDLTLKSGGFFEFSGNRAALMLDSLELPA